MQNSVRSRRSFIASLAAVVPAARWLRAQESETTFSSDVRVVNVLATVRDKSGKFVSNLAKDDFQLSEEGRPQTIKYFSQETNLPLTLGLLVDTSMSQRRVLSEEKTASYRFLDKVLRADKDQTFVIHFDFGTELLQDLTSSRQQLQKALDELELPADQRRGSGSGGNQRGGSQGGGYPGGGNGSVTLPGGIGFPGGGMGGRRGGRGGGGQGGGRQGGGRQGGGTTLYDAILLASDEITRKQKGRKALILLTDGVDHGSKTSLSSSIEAAQRADTLVYSILFSDSSAYPGGILSGGKGEAENGKKVLERISRETGGSFYEVSKKLSIDQIYDRLQEELRNQYSIGYTSDKAADDSAFRAIKVTTKRSGLTVQSREGYYGTAR